MSDRLKGSLLLATGVLILGGVSNSSLPILSFWLGLILYPIGGYLFLKGNRKAGEELERQVQRALNPTIRSQTAAAFAKQQAERPGDGFSPPARSMPVASPHAHNESGYPGSLRTMRSCSKRGRSTRESWSSTWCMTRTTI